MKKYMLLFINLLIIVNSFNYSIDDYDIVVTSVNDFDYSIDDYDIVVSSVNDFDYDLMYYNINKYLNNDKIIKIDFNTHNNFFYLVYFLI